MPRTPLSQSEITARLATIGFWQLVNGEIVRTFQFPHFVASLAFVNQVGQRAEAANHHPDIDIRYNKVRLALVTHDAGGLTVSDFNLAAEIDSLA
jgi:4a-hydroxytetrahydrobiopterin dehydratase